MSGESKMPSSFGPGPSAELSPLTSTAPRAAARPCRPSEGSAGTTSRLVLQSLPHAVLLLDDHLRIVLANRAASTLFGMPAEQLHGRSFPSIVPQTQLGAALRQRGSRVTKVLEAALPANGPARAPATVRITTVTLSLPAALPVPGGPERDFRLLVLEDTSEKARLEQQLVESEKRAAIGQLAAGILHEVANPLTSLASNLLFVRSTLAAARSDVKQALDVSLDQLEEMRRLLGTLSSVPSRVTPRYELADPRDVVRTCVTLIAKEAERRHIRLSVAFGPAPVTCEMDVRLIRQVLLNLLKNAMEAMPHGGRIEVRTSVRPRHKGQQAMVVIEIADTGIGIFESDLRKVFRPLFSTKPRGAGLGLSFCRQAVEEHGGAIRLASAGADRGTVAIVSLPVRQTPPYSEPRQP